MAIVPHIRLSVIDDFVDVIPRQYFEGLKFIGVERRTLGLRPRFFPCRLDRALGVLLHSARSHHGYGQHLRTSASNATNASGPSIGSGWGFILLYYRPHVFKGYMPIIHFIGGIVPASARHVTLAFPEADGKLTSKYSSPENNLEASIIFHIKNSLVDVECEVNRFSDDPDFIGLIHKPVFDLTQALVSLVDFNTGYGLNVYFDYLVNPKGERSALLLQHPRLAALCSAFRLTDPTGFMRIVFIVLSDFSLCMALNDLNEAITLTHHATHSCARCIERLRTAMCGETMDRREAWIQFRSNLQMSREYINYITDRSAGSRHGDPTFIPGPEVTEVTERSWTIVNRFLEFRKRGNIALPLSEFPLL